MPSCKPNHCWWLCFTLKLHDGGSGLRLNDGLFVKLKPVGWGLTICFWPGPPWFNYWFSFTLVYRRISHDYSSLFIIVINLIFTFLLSCIDWIGSFVWDSHLATLWEGNCPFGFLLVMFPLGSSYFVFVFLSLWCLWWEMWDNCIDSWSLPSLHSFYANRSFTYFCIKSSIGTQGEVG